MNKVIVVIGIIICVSGVILFAIVLSQPPTNDENLVRRNPNEPPDVLYFTPVLPIFVLSGGVWMIAIGSKK